MFGGSVMNYQEFEDHWEDVLKDMYKDLEGSIYVSHKTKSAIHGDTFTNTEREEVFAYLAKNGFIERDDEDKFKIMLTPKGGSKAEILVHPWKGWIRKGIVLVKKHATLAIIAAIAASGVLGGLTTVVQGLIKIVAGI